jgi:hypothetical protein
MIEKPKRQNPKETSVIKVGVSVGRGENKTVIVPAEVEKLAKLWCSYEEMSAYFNVPANTLKYNFSDIIAKGRSETKQALRRAQLKVALEGNTTMLIWLGKNILGQADSPSNEEEDKKTPELTQEQIDERINELLKVNNEKNTKTSGKSRTDIVDTIKGSEGEV